MHRFKLIEVLADTFEHDGIIYSNKDRYGDNISWVVVDTRLNRILCFGYINEDIVTIEDHRDFDVLDALVRLGRVRKRVETCERYYMIDHLGRVLEYRDKNTGLDEKLFKYGNYFASIEEAKNSDLYKTFQLMKNSVVMQ